MITCPQCGQNVEEGAQFCDRCGVRLTEQQTERALVALAAGHRLARGYTVVELINQTPEENWYKATRQMEGEAEQHFVLRERAASPSTQSTLFEEQSSSQDNEAESEKAVSPTAKTKELPPLETALQQSKTSDSNEITNESEQEEQQSSQQEVSTVIGDAAEESPGDVDTANQAEQSDEGEVSDLAPEKETERSEEKGSLAEELETKATDKLGQNVEVTSDDLGELFSRIRDISRTLTHPAFYRAVDAFGEDGRVYLAYPDEPLVKLSERLRETKISESQALSIAIQVCQAVSFLHKRGFRMNDICPESVALCADGRIKLTGLDWITNDTEIVPEPLLNDGYTAPEVYRGQRVDKRADIFSVACLLYTCLTGERIESESWLEEAGPIRFYPPHVITPTLERVLRRALAFRPEDRYQTIDEFKAELLKIFTNVRVRAAALTDIGMVREINEDSILAWEYLRDSLIEPDQAYLYVVSDGMGGAAAGEVASAIAVETIKSYVEKELEKAQSQELSLSSIAVNALEEANRKIIDYQQEHPDVRGMGATGVVALVRPPKAAIAWVGDSRGYIWDNNGLRQITKDHSLAQRLIDIGQLTPEQARHYEHKNVILRSLGARQSGPAGAEVTEITLKRGDRLLLCSDGLTTHVEDGQIDAILRRHTDPFEAARELIAAANAGGGTDNISVILVFAE